MNETITYLHSQFPVQMGKLYVKYGLGKARLSMQTTKDLATVYGDDFIHDLKRYTGVEFDSFFGKKLFGKKEKDGEQSNEDSESKGKFLDKLKGFGKKALGAYAAAKGADSAANAAQPTPDSPKKDEKILGLSKPLFYAVVAVALILVVYAVSKQNKTSAGV